MAKNALGKGFDGLIPTGMEISSIAEPSEQIKKIDIDKITINPEQPRRVFDETALMELAESIKQHGIIQPLVLTPLTENGMYRIVAGERRYRAAKIAGNKKVPAVIRNHKELEELEVALVENVQRVDLSPLEQALSIVKLRDQFSLTPKEIAKKLGKAETTISNIVRLLQLPKDAVVALQKGDISEGHARAILALKNDTTEQEKLLQKIIKDKLSVRDAEEYVHLVKAKDTELTQSEKQLSDDIAEQVKKKIGTKATIQKQKKGGFIKIVYKNDDDLKSILGLFKK